MTKKIAKRKKKPLERLTIKHIRFLEEYVKTGKLAPSWMHNFASSNNVIAYVSANRFLKKNPEVLDYFYDMAGISDQAIAKAISDGFNAKRQIVKKGVVHEFDDPYARMKAAEIARKIKGYDRTSSEGAGNQLNVQIINEGGQFKVSEG